MTGIDSAPYIPGKRPQKKFPLGRYLPPAYSGVASTWLAENIPAGSWLLDPFGATPNLALEAAQRGYRILVAANNPINRFILEMLANPPANADFQAALATLATSTVGKERLEPHIKALYTTQCAACNATIQAEAFLWKQGSKTPYGRIYHCPHCQDSGERAITAKDMDKASRFGESGLHKARAMERVAPINDPDRVHVEEALTVYPPRAIYVLVTLVNKLSKVSPDQRRLLSALLLITFDQANTLWPYPVERERPRQLTVPPHYREENIWMALENAIELWTTTTSGVLLAKWPDSPPEAGGICLFDGRMKDLSDQILDLNILAVVTTFPRPNQAFWTLSALWSGWLWGHGAVEHFKSVLRRRRYDWGWHTTAISATLTSLGSERIKTIPIFGTINEVEPGFLSAVILGATMARLNLKSIALRKDDGQAQIIWGGPKSDRAPGDETNDIAAIIPAAAREYLIARGESSAYIYPHAAGLLEIAKKPPVDETQPPYEFFSQVQASFQQELSFRNGFLRFEGSPNSLEVGRWWLQDPGEGLNPLADRVEMVVVQHLVQNPTSEFGDIDRQVCAKFPGLMPPEGKLIQICLGSYGNQDQLEEGCWTLQGQDSPSKRRADIFEMEKILLELGKRLEFDIIQGKNPVSVHWMTPNGQPGYTFYISASSVLGKYFFAPQSTRGNLLIVLPGSRANLVAYKLKCDPHLRQIAGQGWQFIKYRHLRQLSESSTLNRDNFGGQLGLDPLTYAEPQMRLF